VAAVIGDAVEPGRAPPLCGSSPQDLYGAADQVFVIPADETCCLADNVGRVDQRRSLQKRGDRASELGQGLIASAR
jgi:hypothetical protein